MKYITCPHVAPPCTHAATAQHHPSMLQDILQNKPTEIDAINGAICRMGNECGVKTPTNTFLCTLIKALEAASPS